MTHTYLLCSHCIGRNRSEYMMRCESIKEMPDAKRLKVRVFGDRFWKQEAGKETSRIRYVDKSRVVETPW